MKPSFAVVGCGKVGLNLVKYLSEAGYRVCGLASRSIDSAKKAADIAGEGRISIKPSEITQGADIVFITTPDGMIEDVCNEIADDGGFTEGTIVFHCSGSLPSTILDSAKKSGAVIGSMHPLQSFATTDGDKNPFFHIIVAVEGHDKAVETGLAMAEDLGAKGFKIQTDSKTMYHASAVVASNCLVTLVDFAYQLLDVAGIGSKDAYAVLGPLIEGTLSNIKRVGPTEALTGPVVRGDYQTVASHLGEIMKKTPQLADLYKILGFHTIEIAKKRGTLTETSESELHKLLT